MVHSQKVSLEFHDSLIHFVENVASLVVVLIAFVSDHVLSKLLALEAAPIESFFIELNFCIKE